MKEPTDIFNNSTPCRNSRPLSNYLDCLSLTRKDIYSLQGCNLLLVGGGRSPIQKTFDRLHIKCNVTNVDPYIENPDPRATNIKQDFVFTDFENEFDEIWALWSLPLYSPNPLHAGIFYTKAAIALKPGGILRVCPLPNEVRGILLAPHLGRSTLTDHLIETVCDEWLNNDKILVKQNEFAPDRETRLMHYWRAPNDATKKNALNMQARKTVTTYINFRTFRYNLNTEHTH